jgi:hypothetical protein
MFTECSLSVPYNQAGSCISVYTGDNTGGARKTTRSGGEEPKGAAGEKDRKRQRNSPRGAGDDAGLLASGGRDNCKGGRELIGQTDGVADDVADDVAGMGKKKLRVASGRRAAVSATPGSANNNNGQRSNKTKRSKARGHRKRPLV